MTTRTTRTTFFLLWLWLMSTYAIANTGTFNDSLYYYRIKAVHYNEEDKEIDHTLWSVSTSSIAPEQRSESHFSVANDIIIVSYGSLSAVFQPTNSASSFNTLIRGIIEQITKNTTSVQEVIRCFWQLAGKSPVLYISNGEYIRLSLVYAPEPILPSPEETPLVVYYSLQGDEKIGNLPKGEILIKVSTFPSGKRNIEKILIK